MKIIQIPDYLIEDFNCAGTFKVLKLAMKNNFVIGCSDKHSLAIKKVVSMFNKHNHSKLKVKLI